jgi:hypothetical protein
VRWAGTSIPRDEASARIAAQNAASTTALVTAETITTAPALAVHTRSRRGWKRSWLLIDPEFQSAPANVVPTSITRPASSTITVGPRPRDRSRTSSAERETNHSIWGPSWVSHWSGEEAPKRSGRF